VLIGEVAEPDRTGRPRNLNVAGNVRPPASDAINRSQNGHVVEHRWAAPVGSDFQIRFRARTGKSQVERIGTLKDRADPRTPALNRRAQGDDRTAVLFDNHAKTQVAQEVVGIGACLFTAESRFAARRHPTWSDSDCGGAWQATCRCDIC
jgi:hypothetical protein